MDNVIAFRTGSVRLADTVCVSCCIRHLVFLSNCTRSDRRAHTVHAIRPGVCWVRNFIFRCIADSQQSALPCFPVARRNCFIAVHVPAINARNGRLCVCRAPHTVTVRSPCAPPPVFIEGPKFGAREACRTLLICWSNVGVVDPRSVAWGGCEVAKRTRRAIYNFSGCGCRGCSCRGRRCFRGGFRRGDCARLR